MHLETYGKKCVSSLTNCSDAADAPEMIIHQLNDAPGTYQGQRCILTKEQKCVSYLTASSDADDAPKMMLHQL